MQEVPTTGRLAPTRVPSDGRGWVAAGIFLSFFGCFLLTTSRERPWTDAKAIHQVAENLVKDQSFAIDIVWPPGSPRGRNGRFYAVNPLLSSLVHVPGAYLQKKVVELWPAAAARSFALTSHLAPAALGALTCALLFLLCRQQRLSFAASSLTTLVAGLATSIWVYSRYPYSEILQAACFTGFVLALLRVRSAARPRSAALVLGLVGSALINSKLVYALTVVVGAGLVAWTFRRERRRLIETLLWMSLGLVPGLVMAAFYNWVRWGSPLRSGYSPFLTEFFEHGNLLTGLWGLFLSPGTSVFLYSPPLLIALAGLAAAWRGHRTAVATIALTSAPVIFLYGCYAFWMGGWNWGPRYLVFALPVFLFPLGVLFDRLQQAGRRWMLAAVFAVALGTGGFVQVLGNAFYWDHYIRIAQEARQRWLGRPDRRGSVPPDQGDGCHACFEDMYAVNWLPAFQPIEGHLWLLRHVPWDHDWRQAEQDAPWHRYTRLNLDIAQTYRRARVDFWGLDYASARDTRAKLLAAMLVLIVSGTALWVFGPRLRRLRLARAAAPSEPAAPEAAPT